MYEFREITAWDVFTHRCSTELSKSYSDLLEDSETGDLERASLSILMILLHPFVVVYWFFQYLSDISNPEFDAQEEYNALKPYSQVYCGELSMSYFIFCDKKLNMTMEEATDELQDAVINNNGNLVGILLRNKHAKPVNVTQLLSREEDVYGLYHVSFGNTLNRALFSLFHETLVFKKENKETYFLFNKNTKARLEEKLCNLLQMPEVHVQLM